MTADGMNTAMGKLLENQVRHAITPDRTKRLAQHAVVAEVLGGKNLLSATAPTVARGANENTNGLLRKYCPNDEYIEKAV